MDLTEEILTSRYRLFKETQPPKSLKDYKYFFMINQILSFIELKENLYNFI